MASRTSKIILGSGAAVLLALLATVLLVRVLFVDYYVIPQNGMYPSLPSGSRLLTVKHPYAAPSEVKRGDIVVFTRDETGKHYIYIWRVVGLPGDTIEAVGASLAINGRPVVRERIREDGRQSAQCARQPFLRPDTVRRDHWSETLNSARSPFLLRQVVQARKAVAKSSSCTAPRLAPL